jgi:hypothetical protein
MRLEPTALASCLAVLTAFANVPAQQPAADAELQHLLADLGNDDRSFEAVRKLTQRGAPAVTALLAAIPDPKFRSAGRSLANAVYVLGRMGDVAAPAAPTLLAELRVSHGDVVRNLYWALGEIGPKAQADGIAVLEPLRALQPEPGWNRQEWNFALTRIELGLALSRQDLAGLLQQVDHVLAATSSRCQRNSVSGVTMVANRRSALRPGALAFCARRRRWASVRSSRRLPSACLSARFSSRR